MRLGSALFVVGSWLGDNTDVGEVCCGFGDSFGGRRYVAARWWFESCVGAPWLVVSGCGAGRFAFDGKGVVLVGFLRFVVVK